MKPTFTRLARLFVSFLFLYSLGLYAQIGPGIAPVNSPNGGFNIDGTLMSNSTTGDWIDGTGLGGFVLANSGTPLNTKTTYHLYDVFNSGTDDIFGGGDKVSDNPNTMTWVAGTANNKTDMNNALIHFTTDANGNVWFVFAADRLSNSGNAYIDFEFLQDGLTKTATGFSTTASNSTGGRTEGDFLLTVYFESGVAKFDIQRWTLVSGVWQYKTYYSSLPVNSVYAAGNLTTITVPYPAFGTNSYPQNTFIESAVNLTEVLGAIDPCASLKIKTIFVKSKTSTAPSASIKDFFEPQAISNLTLGSADAGDDDTVCSGGNYKLQGTAVPSSNYSVVSTTWSVISGNATIATPSALDSYVTVNGGSATLRLTVETHSGTGAHCIVYDDVIITSTPSPSCLISGVDGPICPSTESSFSAPSSTSYLWSISGNGTISGSTTSQTVNITTGQNCNASFTLTLNITDVNGCTSSCTKTITVIDNTAPVVSTASGSLDHTIQCSNTTDIDSALNEVPTATDNCSATPTIHLVSDVNTPNANCANAYSRVRTWNFTDGCGNTSANFVQTITVIDNTAPVVSTTSGSLDHTIQCSNTTDIDSALNEVPTATDNCSATPTIHLVSDVNTPNANCANAYSRVRTWNFTDGCGNTSANFVQTITVIDNTAPVVSTASGSLDHTIQCSNTTDIDSALNEVPTATDNCSATPTIHLVSDVNTPNANCANAYSRVRTWNFTDGCGNTSANFVQTITVIDNTAPVVSTASGSLDHTIQCSNTTDIDSALNEVPTATDNCSATPTIHLVSDVNTPNANCANAYSRVRTWNFTDGCGNTSANFVQTITVIDNTAPVVSTASGSLDHTIQCSNTTDIDSALNEVPTATDNCSATPTIHLVSDVNTPNANCANAYSRVRTWNFTDGCGNTSANFVQTITVIDNTAPVVSTASGSLDHTIQCSNTTDIDSALNEVPTATDNCSATPTIHLVSDVNTPNANCANAYSRVRTWNFTDGCGNTSANFVQTITVIDNTAPVVSTASGSLDHTIQCSNTTDIDSALNEVPTATDNCSATPTIHLVSDVNTPNANCANAYSRVRTWNFTDGCGNTSANFVQTITVIDNTAPVVSTASGSLDHTIQCSNTTDIDSALNEVPTATDNCSATPTIHLVSDVNTPNANCANAYSRVRTWNFTDGCGNTSANFVQTITVIDNTAPVVSTASGSLDHTIQCSNTTDIDSALNEVPTATDNCSATPTIHLVSDVNTPNANCANAYSRVRTWNFTDGCGNTSANFVQTITVIDNTAPVVSTASGSLDHTIQCSNTTDIDSALNEVPTATDNCSATPTIHLVSDVNTPNANCANAYSRVRTWNFTDGCGNTSANFVQTITVIDNTAPVVSTTSGSLDHTIQCSNTTDIDSALSQVPTATDNCSATPTIHLVSDVNTPNANCANAYSRVRTWNFTDGCGNTSANFVQTITVIDNTAPVVSTTSGSLDHTIQCSNTTDIDSALNEVPTATDNCSATPTIHLVSDVNTPNANCANAYSRVRTWNFTDGCGNTSANFVQTITVIDNTAPVVSTTSGSLDHTIQCSNTTDIDSALNEVPTATDNCSATPTIHLVSDVNTPNANCANAYSRVRTWNFTDGCGNTSANFVQTITVIDNTAPTWVTETGSLNTTIECSDAQALANAQNLFPIATDNCDTNLSNIVKVAGPFVASETCANAGTYTNTWTVKDDCGNTSEIFTQTITTQDTTAPTFIAPADITLSSGTNCYADISTTTTGDVTGIQDNCDPNPTTSFIDSDCFGNFNSASVNSGTGNYFPFTVSGFGNVSANAIKKVALAFETNQGKGRAEFILVAPNGQGIVLVAPYCNGGDCDNPTHNEKELYLPEFYPNSSNYPKWDNNNPIVTNSVQNFTPNGDLSTTNTVNGLNTLVSSFEEFTGNVNGNWFIFARKDGTENGRIEFKSVCLTPGSNLCGNNKVIIRKWSVSDACSNTVAFNQIITITDTTAPTWTTETGSLNTSVECSDTQALANAQNLFPIATDNCDTNLSNIVKGAGPFVASETCANAGTYTNTWTVTDDCGNTSEMFTQVINVMDTTVPTWTTETGSLNTTVECSDAQALANAQNLFPIATDNCDTNLSNIVKVAGPFVASETCANAGTYTNTWTVTDDCGNTSEMFTQVINVMDTTVPTWTTETGSLNTTVECSDAQALANAQNLFPIATDNCDTNLSNIVKVAGPFVASETCANAGTYTNTWTVTDDCGNTSETFTQVITIQDKTAPKIITEASDRTIECDGECDNNEIVNWLANNGGAIVSDNCSEVTWTNNFDTIVYNCYTSITVTFTATDACGNTASTSAKFTAQDTTPPVVPEVLTDITVECTSNLPVILTPTSNNNGFNNVTIEEVNSIELGKCENSYTLFRTLNFKDTCDNISSVSQTVHVVDNTPPTIASLPETKTITCPDVPVFEQAIATDGCSNSSLTFNDVKTEGNCPGFYSITRTWRAIDSCGNSTTASQTINVEDRTGPITTTEFSPTINVNCDAIPARPELVFTDGCSTINPAVFTEIISNQTTDSYVINRKWSVSDTCGNTSEFVQTVNVTIANSLITLTGSVCNDGDTTSIDLTSLFPNGTPTTGTWTDVSNTGKLEGNNFNATTLAVGDYIFEYTINDSNCPRSIRITVTVTTGCGGIVLPCGTIVVHNAFSPNGDGINEKFVIDNINDTNCYPDNTVEIYNRWGVLVYSTKGYNNTTNAFDGISIGQSGISQSSGLPAGTYFYILNYTSFDNDNTIQNNKKVGYLFLTK